MSALPTTPARFADIPFAPQPLNEGGSPRAARNAEGASRPAPSVLRLFAGDVARMCLEAAALAAFLAAILFWSAALSGG